MSVDVFTYLTNLYAEKTKEDITRSDSAKVITEIAIPSFSVLCLLGVSVYITYDAANILHHPPAIDDVPISYMYGFAICNLFIDIICGAFFYSRGRDVFYETKVLIPTLSLDTYIDNDEEFGHLDEDLDVITPISSNRYINNNNSRNSSGSGGDMNNNENNSGRKNLNMLSAFTHVSGDTIRTISVIIAALISTIFKIDVDICDAWAAIGVCATIFVMSVPLIADIIGTAISLSRSSSQSTSSGVYSPITTKEPIL